MKKVLVLVVMFFILSSFAYANNQVSYYKFSSTLTDEWGSNTLTAAVSETYSSNYPIYATSGNGANASYNFTGANSLISTEELGRMFCNGAEANGTLSFWYNVTDGTTLTLYEFKDEVTMRTQIREDYNLTFENNLGGTNYLIGFISKPLKLYHIAYVYNSLEGIKLYVNGKLNASKAITGTCTNGAGADRWGSAANGIDEFFTGIFDELQYHNRSMSAEDVLNVYNYGFQNGSMGNVFVHNATIFPSSPDIIDKLACGYNVSASNSSTLVNVSITWFTSNTSGTLFINNDTYDQTFTSVIQHRLLRTNATGGNFSGTLKENTKYKCQVTVTDGKHTTRLNSTVVDLESPTITLNPSNAFNRGNFSLISQYIGNFTLNISFADNHKLFAYSINITQAGNIIFNYTNTSDSLGQTASFIKELSKSSFSKGLVNITIMVSDSHTDQSIADYNPSLRTSQINYNTAEGNAISIRSESLAITKTTKLKDRYDFNFNFIDKQITDRIFHVTSDKKIHYLSDSIYPAHFVIPNGNQGNWIDFSGSPSRPTVKKLTDLHYTVSIKNLEPTIKFNSIGGQNVRTESYTWFNGNTTMTPVRGLSNHTNIFVLNITKSETINGIWADFIFNGTRQNDTFQTNFTDFMLFTNNHIPPDVNISENLTYMWNISVIQGDLNTTSFNVSRNFSNNNLFITNCNNAVLTSIKTLNFSLKNEIGQALVSGDMTSIISIWSDSSIKKPFSFAFTGVETAAICKFPDFAELNSSIQVSYESSGFDPRQFTSEKRLSNATTAIDLFLLAQNNGTTVFIFVRDENDQAITGAFVTIQRFFPAENKFKTTEVLATGFNGEVASLLVLNDVTYKFIVTKDGVDLPIIGGNTDKVYSNLLYLNVKTVPAVLDNYFSYQDMGFTLTCDNKTSTVTLTYSDPSGRNLKTCLRTIRKTAMTDIIINETCKTSSSDSIIHIINSTASVLYMSTGRVVIDNENQTYPLGQCSIDNRADHVVYGNLGLLLGFLLAISLIVIGATVDTGTGILFSIIALITTSLMGFLAISASALSALVILFLMAMARQKRL